MSQHSPDNASHSSSQGFGGTWPEQNAVDAWLEKHGVKVEFSAAMELKEAVTAYRIQVQRLLEAEKEERRHQWDKRKEAERSDVRSESVHGVDYKALYHELLFGVGNKWPGETRHQTALRYIQQAERGSDNPSQEKQA